VPCYQISTISTEFKASNFGLLSDVVKASGAEIKIHGDIATVTLANGLEIKIANGQASGPWQVEKAINALRVAYSQAIVTQAKAWAQQKGWAVQQQSPNKMSLTKGQR
jgi:hypothetical protein